VRILGSRRSAPSQSVPDPVDLGPGIHPAVLVDGATKIYNEETPAGSGCREGRPTTGRLRVVRDMDMPVNDHLFLLACIRREAVARRVLNNDDCSGLPPVDCSAPS